MRAQASLSQLLDELLHREIPSRGPCNPTFLAPRRWQASTRPEPLPSAALRSPQLPSDVLAQFTMPFVQRRSRSAQRGWQGKLPSRKMGRVIRARSHLELRLFELCEIDADVTFYVEQPISLTYLDPAGKVRRHVPDAYIEDVEGRRFVEVKWEADAASAQNEARWPCIGQTLASHGFTYEVLTERQLLAEPRASNIRDLMRRRRAGRPDEGDVRRLQAVLQKSALEMQVVLARFPMLDEAYIGRLMADGDIRSDLHRRLGPASLLSAPKRHRAAA